MAHLTLFPMGTRDKIILGAKILVSGKRKKWTFICAGVVVLLIAGLVVLTAWRKSNYVAVVNHHGITADEVAAKARLYPEIYRDYARENLQTLVEDYINQFLLYQRARHYARRYRKDIDSLMREYYQETLVKTFVEKEIVGKIKIPDDEITLYYNSHLAEFVRPEKARLFEIVVASKDDADNIINRLILGEDFETIARRESVSSSRDRGGDLGWIDRDKLDPQLADIVSQMKPGQILGKVVKTNLGYHIIKVAGVEPKRVLSYEEAKVAIRDIFVSQRKREEVEKYIKVLRDRSRITISEKKIGVLKDKLQ